jgi:hypothetical protein
MGGGCGIPDSHSTTDCCEVRVVNLPSFQAPSFTPSHLLVILLDGPQPPPGILPFAPSNTAVLPSQLLTYFQHFPLPSWYLGTRTYLLTHRLRN